MVAGRFFNALGRMLYALAAADGDVSDTELRELARSIETASSGHFHKHGYFMAGMLLAKISFLKAMERKEHPAAIMAETEEVIRSGYGFPLTDGERKFLRSLMHKIADTSGGIKQAESESMYEYMALIS